MPALPSDLSASRAAGVQHALAAAAASGGLLWLAFNQGAFDVVPRQTAGIVVWWGVAIAAVALRVEPVKRSRAALAATLLLAGIALWIALDFGASPSAERTATEIARAVMHLGPVLLIGWALPHRLWPSVVGGLTAAAVVVCGYAVATRLDPGLGPVVFSSTLNRLSNPLGYWNAVGSWAVMTAALLVGVSAHARATPVRAVALAAVPLATTAAYLTYSRSVIGAGLVAAIVLVSFAPNRWTTAAHLAGAACAGLAAVFVIRANPAIADSTGAAGAWSVVAALAAGGAALAALTVATRRLGADGPHLSRLGARIGTGVAIAAAVLAGGVAYAAGGQRAWEQFQNPVMANEADPAARLVSLNGSRYLQWESAIDAWQEKPWTGTGAGTFEFTWNASAPNSEFVKDAHNAFVETLSEQGVPGFLLLVGFVVSAGATFTVARRRTNDPAHGGMIAAAAGATGAFVAGTGLDWLWEVTALATLALALLGAAIAATSVELDRGPSHGTLRRSALVALSMLAILVQLPGLVGTSELRRSQEQVTAGDLGAARAHADQAIDIMPWAASPFLQRALVDEQDQAWNSARRSIELAIRRDPLDWRYPLVLARIEAKAGEPEAALAAYRKAKALRPQGQFFE